MASPIFCVSIGVYNANDNSPFCGVVYDPLHDELFSAQRNLGGFLNDEPIKVSTTDDLGYSMLATGFPYDKENSEINNVDKFQRFLPKLQGIRRLGSAAIDLCYVACGRLDGYWEGELCKWDTAAGSLIVEEAGGTATHYNGKTYTLDQKDIVASNDKIHKAMIDILNS
jgi:myo-inositol-1(or 4)-monophosphatase